MRKELLVSGVASQPFLSGFDPNTKIWDKSRTGSPVKKCL